MSMQGSMSAGGAHPLSMQIRVHQLNNNENLDSVLFRVQKGWVVQFKLGPSLFGKRVRLFFNYPENTNQPYSRSSYHELKWKSQSINQGDDTSLYSEVMFEIAGTFRYFFFHSESEGDNPNGSGFILVEPTLTYGPENEVLPLDCILCQTFLAKCLGSFPEWEQRLRVAKETGYNMVHLTPIQELGASLSSYSLRNQLKLNSMFYTPQKSYSIEDVAELVEKMKREWKVLVITDVVLNHTANESEWLQEHPESTYNLTNSPHLRPSYLLDRALWYLAMEIAAGKWENSGIPIVISEEGHLNNIRSVIHEHFLRKMKIYELFMVHIENVVSEFQEKLKKGTYSKLSLSEKKELSIVQDPDFRRWGSGVDLNIAVQIYANQYFSNRSDTELESSCMKLRQALQQLNDAMKNEIEGHLSVAVENVIKAVRYERLDQGGPRLGAVTKKHPLVPQYFTHYGPDADVESDEKLIYSEKACYIMAHNGWVMGDNPLRNFAEPGSNVYLRRELIAWGDSVKLRYGNCPEDSPYLWEHMTQYVQQTARAFHGLRLDNCHSTPIHVAEYLIDKAREARPDLYVIAELFTSSEAIDNVFVNRLGITSLVREAMSAPDAHEEGRLVYRYGGYPVGAFVHPVVRPLTMSIAHAIFMDVTHDNPSPVLKRSVFDLFPSAAIVSMACCATGSTRGYDELVPHHIHVVDEDRLYMSWDETAGESCINSESGIIAGKRALNKLHTELGLGGYSQVFVDQRDYDTVAVTRHCPATHESVILVARTAFSTPGNPKDAGFVPPLKIPGVIDEVIFEGKLVPKSTIKPHVKHNKYVNGLADYQFVLREHILLYESDMVEVVSEHEDGSQEIDFVQFPHGSVIAFRVSLESATRSAILKIRACVSQFGYRMRTYSGQMIQRQGKDFESIISRLSLVDLNRVLFRCDAEEKDDGNNFGTYNIPGYGSLVYCGLQGIMTELMSIHLTNDLGHPFCDNLRQGDWLPNYISERLIVNPSTCELGNWFKNVFQNLSSVPRYLVPCYFDSIITGAYSSIVTALWRKMSEFVSEGSVFVKALALGSVALGGIVNSSPFPILSPSLEPPVPKTEKGSDGKECQLCTTMSAGLPHFCVGYMRNWGRDTFISVRGLFLITGRSEEARYIILAFGACLRHGLIPNLLDRGVNSRFNCRDATWWWLKSIQDYTEMVTEGYKILNDKVSRLFPTDDSPPLGPGECDQPLADIIQEALQKHFQGLKFRERNAGWKIDEQMKDNGFNNEIGVDLETGFVFGGNADNCGTWMDKMGSSEAAGNKGVPATPRDGSAVELVGLCFSALKWLDKMNKQGHYNYSCVKRTDPENENSTITWTFSEWADRICINFEKCFWVDKNPLPTDEKYVNKRGIYKDCYKASAPWTDYQLRPNFCVTMAVAPELFTPERAWIALEQTKKCLLGPLGMRTLDPEDWAYNGNYNNQDNSTNHNTARGFNYHQGPEWLWPIGYFLRARIHFARPSGGELRFIEAMNFTKNVLSKHFEEIQSSKWKGLPELTNKDGSFCPDSCPIQAWSHASVLEVLYDMDNTFSSS